MSEEPMVTAIIVSYNVRELLLATLRSLFANTEVPLQVVVIDNASGDGSADAVREEFPLVNVVAEQENLGFGRGNNIGLHEAVGRFILLLNPDVEIGPGCIDAMTDFLLVHPEAGAVGPRLARPSGKLDLAARRGFPTPKTSFYRFTGLSRIFPHSRTFNGYNMGHQSVDKVHEMDAGTAACLLVRRTAIDQVGFFDPDFFMYGEDLDLCYRLKAGGWKTYYLPSAHAIHVKGASSRQSTARSLYAFHSAMWTFHHKHYASTMPAFANGLIWASIWGRWAALRVRAGITEDPRVSR